MSSRRYRTKDTVGKIGEDTFRSWAGAVGLVVNGSGDDQAGWDFIVESNPQAGDEPSSTPFAHADSFPIRARVQVKATDSTDGHIDVKLSNWVRMVESPDPAFFFVIELNGQDVPQRAWLYHVGSEDWHAVEKRKWANDVGNGKKKRRPLHKLTRRLHYATTPALPDLSGGALLDVLAGTVGASLSDYSSRKLAGVQAAGFEEGNVRLTLHIDGAPDRLISEAQLSLRPSVPVRQARVTPMRFGIEHVSQTRVIDDALLFVQTPAGEVPVEVLVESQAATARIPAVLRAPNAVTDRLQRSEPLDGLSVRIVSSFLDIIGRFGEPSSVSVRSPEPDVRTPIRRLHHLNAVTRSMEALARGDAALQFDVTGQEGGIMRFRQEPEAAPPSDNLLEQFPPSWVLDAVDCAWALARRFEVEDIFELSLNEAVDLAEAVAQVLALAAGTADGTLGFQWTATDPTGPSVLTEVADEVVMVSRFTIGNVVFAVAAHLDGTLARTDGDHYALAFASTAHVSTQATRVTGPEPNLLKLGHQSIVQLGRPALVQMMTDDQTPAYLLAPAGK